MQLPLLIGRGLQLATKVLLVARSACFAEKVAPSIRRASAVNDNRRFDKIDAAQRTLRTAGTARPMATYQPASDQVEADYADYDDDHLPYQNQCSCEHE